MDPLAQLALMTKAKLVFESPDTFLSFPALSPLSFPPEKLHFGRPGEASPEDLAEQTQFAMIANQIPRGLLAPIEQSDYLWNVYGEVLKTAQVAAGALDEEEKAHLARTRDFLYETTPEGFRRDSQSLLTYRQYRDANFEAQEEYKNQQLTAEAADDPLVKTRWLEEDEPRLRAEVQRLADEWLTKGLKAEVEAALQVEQAYAARAPSVTWSQWRTSYLEDLDNATDTNLMQAAITSYSPYDVFDMNTWPRFTLSRSEIDGLIRQAPSELKDIFGGNVSASTIESLSFQYRSVAVTRPWFQPAVFKSRFWRLPPQADVLSDGENLTKGRCPAYISALVFARNIEVKFKQGVAETPGIAGRRLLQLQAATLNPQLATVVRRLDESRASAAVAPTVLQPANVSDHRTAVIGAMARARVRDHRAGTAGFAAATHRMRLPTRAYVAGRPGAAVREPASPPSPPPPPAPEPTNEVLILSFICKRIPRCPDPDPAISWT